MQTDLVMTVIAADKPGIVDQLSTLLAIHGGNWLESRMCHLGGQFAGILRVRIPSENETALRQALAEVPTLRVTIETEQADPAATTAGAGSSLVRLELVGQDRPGIVREISRVLSKHDVNVEELETGCENAPMSGEMLFTASAKLHLPKTCNPKALRADLEEIATDLMVDILFGKPAR